MSKIYIGDKEYIPKELMILNGIHLSPRLPDFTLHVTGTDPLPMLVNGNNSSTSGYIVYLLPDGNGKIDVYLPDDCLSLTGSFDMTMVPPEYSGLNQGPSANPTYYERIQSIEGYNRLLKSRDLEGPLSFWGHKNVVILDDVQKFDVSRLENFWYLLNCYNNDKGLGLPEHLDLTSWDVSNIKDFGLLLNSNNTVKTIDAHNWNCSNATSFGLGGCSELTSVDLSDAIAPAKEGTVRSQFGFNENPKLEEVKINDIHFTKNLSLRMSFSKSPSMKKYPVLDCSIGFFHDTFYLNKITKVNTDPKTIDNSDYVVNLINIRNGEVIKFWEPFVGCNNLTTIGEIDLSNAKCIKIGCNFIEGTFKGIGTQDIDTTNPDSYLQSPINYIDLYSTKWGTTEEGLESVRKTLILYSYDRASNNKASLGIRISSKTASLLTEEEKLTIANKGYNLIIA